MVSLVPNACMSFMIEHLLNCEFQGSGLSLEFALLEVQNFKFMEGLIMLTIDIFLYGFIGYYLDQVVPKEVGVAEPWNFICKRFKSKGSKLEEAKLKLHDE